MCGTALVTMCLDAIWEPNLRCIENVVVARRGAVKVGGAMFAHVEGLCRTHDCSKMMFQRRPAG